MTRWWVTAGLVGLAVCGVSLVPRWLEPVADPVPEPPAAPPPAPVVVVVAEPVAAPPVPEPPAVRVRSGRDELLVLGVEHDGALETWLVDADGVTHVGHALATATPNGWWMAEMEERRDGLRAVALYDVADPVRRSGCDPTGGGQFDLFEPSADTDEVAFEHAQVVWFLGPGLITVQQSWQDDTGRGVSIGTCRLGTAGWVPVDVAQVFDDDGAALIRAVGAPLNRWGLARAHGQWVLTGFTILDGGVSTATTGLVPPTSVTGQPNAPEREPALDEDAFSSPSGAFRLTVRSDGFQFEGPDREVSLPMTDRRVVSTQWALGAHAARWRTEVPALFTR